jgi:hypothetical protein
MPLAAIAFIVEAVTDAGGLQCLWTAMAGFELVSLCAVMLVFRRQKDRLQVAHDRPPDEAGDRFAMQLLPRLYRSGTALHPLTPDGDSDQFMPQRAFCQPTPVMRSLWG